MRREIIARYLADFKVSGITNISLREIIDGVYHTEALLAALALND